MLAERRLPVYGLIAAQAVLTDLIQLGYVNEAEVAICQTRIANLEAGGHEEFNVGTLLEAIFSGVNPTAFQYARDYDHAQHERTHPPRS